MVVLRFLRPGCPGTSLRDTNWSLSPSSLALVGCDSGVIFVRRSVIMRRMPSRRTITVQIPRAPMDGAPSSQFGLSLLGGFELTGPDGVVDLPSKKLAGLLAYLACTTPQPQSREKLSALLWGSYFDAQ